MSAAKEATTRPTGGSIDCHVHVFDGDRFPFAPSRSYTPGRATVADLNAFHAGLGVDRAVLVQPSVYADDNRCLLDGLRQLGAERARGVAVIDPTKVSDGELKALVGAGVVGVRVNLNVKGEDKGAAALAAVVPTIKRVAAFNLVAQIYVDMPLLGALEPAIAASPVPMVLDHFAGAIAAHGLAQEGFSALARLLSNGKVWVKLSGPYRASERQESGYDDVAVLAREMLRLNPERLVWASDWPHTGGGSDRKGRTATDVEPFRTVDDARNLALLLDWCGSDQVARQVLVANPAKLFRF